MDNMVLTTFVLLTSLFICCNSLVATACYGTEVQECDTYGISCEDNEIIGFNALYIGSTTNPICVGANQICFYYETCCGYSQSDTVEHLTLENVYRTYTQCSGRQSCADVQPPYQMMSNSVLPSYAQMEYVCKSAYERVHLCGGSTGTSSGQFRTADVVFDGSPEAFDRETASKECACTITNFGSDLKMIFTINDIRMETYQPRPDNVPMECSSAFFQTNVFVSSCVDTPDHHLVNFYRSDRQYTIDLPEGTTTDIILSDLYTNGEHDAPSIIWVNYRALDNSPFTVVCKQLEAADLTTTTTTTTTTTPTTTSTTTTTTTPTTTSTTTTTTTPTTTTTTSTTTTTMKPTTTTTTPTTTTTTPTTTTTTPTTTTTTTPTTTTTTPTTTTTTTPTTTTTTTPTTTPTTTTTTTAPSTTTPTTTTTTPTTTTTTTTTTPTTTTTTPTTTNPTTTPTTTTITTASPTTTTSNLLTTMITDDLLSTNDQNIFTTIESKTTYQVKTGGIITANDDTDVVYLAIFIPLAFGIVIVVLLIFFLCRYKTRYGMDKFNFSKSKANSNAYETFTDTKILDRFIREQEATTCSRPSSTLSDDFEREISKKHLPLNEGINSDSIDGATVQPYSIPLPTQSSLSSAKKRLANTTYHVRFSIDSSSEASRAGSSLDGLAKSNSNSGSSEYTGHYDVIKTALPPLTTSDGLVQHVSDLKSPKPQVFHPQIHLPNIDDTRGDC